MIISSTQSISKSLFAYSKISNAGNLPSNVERKTKYKLIYINYHEGRFRRFRIVRRIKKETIFNFTSINQYF